MKELLTNFWGQDAEYYPRAFSPKISIFPEPLAKYSRRIGVSESVIAGRLGYIEMYRGPEASNKSEDAG